MTPTIKKNIQTHEQGRGGAPIAWHSLSLEDVSKILVAEPDGLTAAAVEERLGEFGRNMLPAPEPPTLFKIILHQFANPLIYILLIAGVIAVVMDDLKDAIFIFAVVTLNALIGTYQEWRAEQKAHALQVLLKIKAKVKRGGRQSMISAEDLVPGDVVLFESGDKVPADVRLTQANKLTIDESFLTGESLPVEKKLGAVDEGIPVSDRKNMAFAGATVITGRGTGYVVATGLRTEVGRIASSITETEGAKPPLLIRMERFARQISVIVLTVATLLGSFLFYEGFKPGVSGADLFHSVFLLMVAMAVSAIPEGLPVAMTVALSIATSRMAARNVVVRKLMAVESLGSCTTIASDKTGTLTVNQQTVKRVLLPDGVLIEVGGQGYNDEGTVELGEGGGLDEDLEARLREIVRGGVLCNEASLSNDGGNWSHSGDAIDVALLSLGYKMKFDPAAERASAKILGEIPFESEKRYAATAIAEGGGAWVVVKGAVENVLACCTAMQTGGGSATLDGAAVLREAEEMAANGYRVLAIAARRADTPEGLEELNEGHLAKMTLLGLLGFIDPLRPEVKDAVAEAVSSGVRVIMITGDHPATALAISRELGIAESQEEVVTGGELSEMPSEETPEYFERIKRTRVFARVTPQQKLQIVDALVKLGEFVAVTGDGVNDAPALRRANISVAMGSGSDIAKDTSLITVVDDNFASIVAGIEEGRFAYGNVRKVTLLLISTGGAELLLLVASILMGLPAPMIAVQILWLNLVTNGIQDVALAFEAGEKRLMHLPPRRPSEGIFDRKMIEQVVVGGVTMGLVCLGAWVYYMQTGLPEDEARTNIFTLLVLMQFYHVFNCRSEYSSAFGVPLRNNWILMAGTATAFGVHLLAMYTPWMQALLRTNPISLEKWLTLGALAGSVMVAMEMYKWIRRSEKPGAS
ncbi:MAG: HAD-IC family P-type ATPase [Bryobacteraceae bacterium]|nr:HAD-IC family P-type ATPase [Solibacteraceae bacterium]MCO5353482.1 HAD-IC family P-type ATPase [Bryobacteraceae bacterium]